MIKPVYEQKSLKILVSFIYQSSFALLIRIFFYYVVQNTLVLVKIFTKWLFK